MSDIVVHVCILQRIQSVHFPQKENHHHFSLQGVDPDAPEDDEENEVEEADGDPEETELL